MISHSRTNYTLQKEPTPIPLSYTLEVGDTSGQAQKVYQEDSGKVQHEGSTKKKLLIISFITMWAINSTDKE